MTLRIQEWPTSFLWQRTESDGAPDLYTAFSRYLTENEWQAIKASLDYSNIGVTADTVTVSRKGKTYSLRDGLPMLAYHCERAAWLRKAVDTPKEVGDAQDDVLELCCELKAALDDCSYNSFGPNADSSNPPASFMRFPELAEPAWRLEDALKAFTAELKRCRNELKAMGGSRGKSNAMAHRSFWNELVRLWRANLGKDVVKWGMRTNHLDSFIVACSRPFFPKETTDQAVRNFVKDLPAFR